MVRKNAHWSHSGLVWASFFMHNTVTTIHVADLLKQHQQKIHLEDTTHWQSRQIDVGNLLHEQRCWYRL